MERVYRTRAVSARPLRRCWRGDLTEREPRAHGAQRRRGPARRPTAEAQPSVLLEGGPWLVPTPRTSVSVLALESDITPRREVRVSPAAPLRLLPRRHRLLTPQDESLPPGPGPSRGVSVLTSSLRLRLLPPASPGALGWHRPTRRGHSASEPSTQPRLQSPLGRVRPRSPGSGEPDVVFGGCCSLHPAGEGRAPFRGCGLACFIHTEPRDTWPLHVAPSAERNVCGSSTNLAGTSLLFTAESYSTCGLGLVGAPPSLLLGDPGRGGDTLPTGGLPSPAPPPTPLHPPNKLPL